jgi:PPOX class probable F420-dependent enzyme
MLREARVARLGLTDDAGAPRVLPVTFALHEGALWTAVDNKPKQAPEPARVRWLRARPAAAITVDRYDEDWSLLAWVQVLGAVAVLDASAVPGGMAALAGKYAQYREDPPPGPVLRLEPDRVLSWAAGAR